MHLLAEFKRRFLEACRTVSYLTIMVSVPSEVTPPVAPSRPMADSPGFGQPTASPADDEAGSAPRGCVTLGA